MGVLPARHGVELVKVITMMGSIGYNIEPAGEFDLCRTAENCRREVIWSARQVQGERA